MKANMRSWVTPLTLGSFILCAVSGILLFFHIDTGMVKLVHQWLSWAFIGGGLLHLLMNWKPMVLSMKRPVGAWIVAAFIAMTALAMVPVGQQQESPVRKVMTAMTEVPLTTLAQVSGHSEAELVEILSKQQIRVENEQQTLSQLTSHDQKQAVQLLMSIL